MREVNVVIFIIKFVSIFFVILQLVKYFINCGMNVNARDHQGATVLHYAAQRNLELASFLGHMAPSLLNYRDNHNRTPLVRAMMTKNFSQTGQIIK